MGRNDGSDSMRMWGTLHKTFRTAAGLSHEDVAKYVGYSVSLVISIERGIRMPSDSYVLKSDEVVGAKGVLIKAAEHLSRQRYPAWFEDYAIEEQRAKMLWTYCAQVLHGLLQTEEYARAIFAAHHPALDDDEIGNRVDARLERQGLFNRKPACTCSFIVEEWVLRRSWGDPAAMKRQLEHLLGLCELRNVTIQVMPTSYGLHAGVEGPLTLLESPEHKYLAYLEPQGIGQLLNDTETVSLLQERYSMIRSQALNPRESVKFIEQLAGEL